MKFIMSARKLYKTIPIMKNNSMKRPKIKAFFKPFSKILIFKELSIIIPTF